MGLSKRRQLGDPDRLFAIPITKVGEFSRLPADVRSSLLSGDPAWIENMLAVVRAERASGVPERVDAATNVLSAYCEVAAAKLITRLRS